MAPAMHPRRPALLRAFYTVTALVASRTAPGVLAQDSDCTEITVSGLTVEDGFPLDSAIYTATDEEEDVRSKYIDESQSYAVWYSPTVPTEYTSDIDDAALSACNGVWVISSYPVGSSFTDTVWYEVSGGVQCEQNPTALDSSEWLRLERANSTASATTTAATVEVLCESEDDDDDSSDDGLSNRTVIVLLIVIGVGFMVLMCLGALACCIKGQNSPEEAIMPPGELGEGSAIGGKVGIETKPGLHAHPEVQGAQHPRPEDWAPAYNSTSGGTIPTGSRSGPSVRSIGYQ